MLKIFYRQQVEEESKDVDTEEERAEKDREEGPWKPVTQTAKSPSPEPVIAEGNFYQICLFN